MNIRDNQDSSAAVESSTQFDARRFRDTLGHYASGIAVIATTVVGEPVGFTCQSFFSVSTEPPLISFSVMRTSTSYPSIRSTGRFSVNVLANDQHDVSNQFSRKGSDKWAGIAWHPSPLDNPLIEGTMMWLDCSIWAEYEAGDHFIVVGQVKEMSESQWHKGSPLLYFKGQYRQLS